jgi:tetratricopeptide (TPR) repeat protein
VLPLRPTLVVVALLIAASADAGDRRAIPGQAASTPRFTTVGVDDERTLGELLRFERFERERVLPWRVRLAPLAEAGDALAQLWLARVYDFYPFGKGTPEDGQVAMRWYTRAAEQHLAAAEHFLAAVYRSGLLGVTVDEPKALAFLERAYADSGGALKAEVALDLARLYMPPRATPPDAARGLQYLEEALRLAPDNQSAIDWLLEIYAKRGDHKSAIKLAERSRNPAMIETIAELCMQKLHDPPCAIRLLRQASAWPREDSTPPEALLELYTLVCRKRLARTSLGAIDDRGLPPGGSAAEGRRGLIDTPEAWKFFMQWQRNCVVQPGG